MKTRRRGGCAIGGGGRALVLGAAVGLAGASAFAAPPRPDHVVIVIEENHSFTQVMGNPAAPYINGLAAAGATFTNLYAITHPSQPNYLHLFSGASQGVTGDGVPAPGTPFTTRNLGAGLIAAGATFVGYSEGLPAVGSTVGTSGNYARKHNPWVNWQGSGLNQLPAAVNRPFTDFPTEYSALPDVAIVVPDLQHDMHNGTVAQGDAWLQANLGAYAAWCGAHNSLLIITFDEDEGLSRDRIPTIFYGPMIRTGSYATTWTAHNVLRTVGDMFGAAPSGAAGACGPIVGVFTTDPVPVVATFRQGEGGYGGAADTYIDQANPGVAYGGATPVVVDGSPLSQGLIRFDGVIGPGAGQVPAGTTVLSAKLRLLTGPSSASSDSSASTMALHRMLADWTGGATWTGMGGGVSADGVEAAATPDFQVVPNVLNAWAIFDVTATVGAWASGAAANRGWAILPAGTDGWRWVSSEGLVVGDRPVLEVAYLAPACAADLNGDGLVDFADYLEFLNLYDAQDPRADFNGDGLVDFADYLEFLNRYDAGC